MATEKWDHHRRPGEYLRRGVVAFSGVAAWVFGRPSIALEQAGYSPGASSTLIKKSSEHGVIAALDAIGTDGFARIRVVFLSEDRSRSLPERLVLRSESR